MTEDGWPLSEGEDAVLLHFADCAFPGEKPPVIGVAVSGGSDSMALLHLFARAQAHRGGEVRAVTVDHRLRPEAADEARFVAECCKTLGVRHDTLIWDHGPIQGNLQDQARRARYNLIAGWARENGIGHVVTGHTADDQAETFLMGLVREAGVDGLAGMRRSWEEAGLRWARPYLLTLREDLRAYLTRNGVGWVDDPSNADERFTRVRARKALKALRPLGITVEKLSTVTSNLAMAQGALRAAASDKAAQVAQTRAGEVIIARAEFGRLGPEMMRRILIGALRWIARGGYAPRGEAVLRLERAIAEGRDATLAGCRIVIADTEIRMTREPKAVTGVEGPTDALWDGRWRLTGPHDPGLSVRALGAAGLRRCEDWRATGQTRAALVVSPAVWCGDTLIAAPLAGLENGWTAEIVAGFHSFLLSH
ncbi:tRNA lysidine(34) synthetase TilS [Defluviimonas sp. SAOS-178_SWC]|uniref:tRNA lysidine(34) synthetase TilS n=1 Tax=Defluviimonas sp. SAOS-178_SWC TaxID=3121287 RepID=UPI003221E0A2